MMNRAVSKDENEKQGDDGISNDGGSQAGQVGGSLLIGWAWLIGHKRDPHPDQSDSQLDRVKSSFAGLAGSCIPAGDKARARRSQDSMVPPTSPPTSRRTGWCQGADRHRLGGACRMLIAYAVAYGVRPAGRKSQRLTHQCFTTLCIPFVPMPEQVRGA